MSRQLIEVSMRRDQLLRVFQRIVCSVNLGVFMCMFMILILIFPADMDTEYGISFITLFRMTFWIMSVCCSVSLNCAGAVSAFLRVHFGNDTCIARRLLAVLGTMYLSLVPTLAVLAALLDKPISLRLILIFCVVLLFYVIIIYRFVEHSKYARSQRINWEHLWSSILPAMLILL